MTKKPTPEPEGLTTDMGMAGWLAQQPEPRAEAPLQWPICPSCGGRMLRVRGGLGCVDCPKVVPVEVAPAPARSAAMTDLKVQIEAKLRLAKCWRAEPGAGLPTVTAIPCSQFQPEKPENWCEICCAHALLPSAPGPTPTCATCRHLRPRTEHGDGFCSRAGTPVGLIEGRLVTTWSCAFHEPNLKQPPTPAQKPRTV